MGAIIDNVVQLDDQAISTQGCAPQLVNDSIPDVFYAIRDNVTYSYSLNTIYDDDNPNIRKSHIANRVRRYRPSLNDQHIHLHFSLLIC